MAATHRKFDLFFAKIPFGADTLLTTQVQYPPGDK
jgi:hypothetical protein